jgi:UDP-N-acetylglucosamine acyltransferase
MSVVHPTAILGPDVELADDVEIGPYSVLEGEVMIGRGCRIGPLCRFEGRVQVAEDNVFVSHCSIGAPPQDLKYRGEPTRVEIGPGNMFREFLSVHRGTPGGGGVTRLGGDGLFMAGSHVAHDCQVGDHVILGLQSALGGHVHVGDHVTFSAASAVHQFCVVGEHAFIGGATIVTKDCIPFMKTVGARPARCFGPNTIGLERKGFSAASREALKRAWRHLHNPKLTTGEACARIAEELGEVPEVARVLSFIGASQRGVVLARG